MIPAQVVKRPAAEARVSALAQNWLGLCPAVPPAPPTSPRYLRRSWGPTAWDQRERSGQTFHQRWDWPGRPRLTARLWYALAPAFFMDSCFHPLSTRSGQCSPLLASPFTLFHELPFSTRFHA